MNRSRTIVDIFPIQFKYIERNKGDTKEQRFMNTAIEFFKNELGFRKAQIEEINIT